MEQQRLHDTSPIGNDTEHLSALVDGECTTDEAGRLSRRWDADARLQQQWDTFHLIGDVLRSDDLARHRPDDPFMLALRTRLASEPVVLAPQTPAATQGSRKARWLRPMSAAAGVVAVAGSVWLLPLRQSSVNGSSLTVQSPLVAQTASARAPGDRVVRQTGLDPYLAAHQQFQSAAAIAPVSGYLRHADHDASER